MSEVNGQKVIVLKIQNQMKNQMKHLTTEN